jgi:hypothetical protein
MKIWVENLFTGGRGGRKTSPIWIKLKKIKKSLKLPLRWFLHC